MKRPGLLALFLLLVAGGAVSQFLSAPPVSTPTNYQSLWHQVDSLDSIGLPESAMKAANSIKAIALKEKNTIQQAKAYIYRSYLTQKLKDKDDDALAGIAELEQGAATLPFPENAMLRSVLAELYLNYFELHRYSIEQRTVNDEAQENMLTWDQADFSDTINRLYGPLLV